MRIFGKKITGHDIKAFGRKFGNNASVFGRKLVNTVDKLAPLAQVIATTAGRPDIAASIGGFQGAVHTGDIATRAGIAAATSKRDGYDNKVINFGEKLNEFKQQANQTNDLLQQN